MLPCYAPLIIPTQAKTDISSSVPLAIFLWQGPSTAPGPTVKAACTSTSVSQTVTKETPSYVHQVRSLNVIDLLFESENGMACKSLMNTHRFQQIFHEVLSKLIMKYCGIKYFDSQAVCFITTVTLLVTYTIMSFQVVTVKISLCVRTKTDDRLFFFPILNGKT